MDLVRGEITWPMALGRSRDLSSCPFWCIDGAPSIGGSIVIAGDLVLIGAAGDNLPKHL